MDHPVLLIILIIAGVTLFIMLIRYLINRGVDKAADAIHNSRVRNKNEQAGSVYQAPTQTVLSTGSVSSASRSSGASSLRPGVEYLRDWYPNYKPAKIRHGMQTIAPVPESQAATEALPQSAAQLTASESTQPAAFSPARDPQTSEQKNRDIPIIPPESAPENRVSQSASPQPSAAQSGCRVNETQQQGVGKAAPTPNYSPYYCCICGKPLGISHAVLFISKDGSEARADRPCYEALRDLGTSTDREAVIRAKQHIFGKWTNHKTELGAYLARYNQSAIAFLHQTEENQTIEDRR